MLARLWADGLPASQIAQQLTGELTRSAILGMVHRTPELRAMRSESQRRNPSSRKPRREPAGPRPRTLNLPTFRLPVEPVIPIVPLHISLCDLNSKNCHWPLGDGPYTFCGHSTKHAPYCGYHSSVAYRAPDQTARQPFTQPRWVAS